MDRWSTATIAPPTVHAAKARNHNKPHGKPLGKNDPAQSTPGSDVSSPAHKIAVARLSHVLSVMRRLGKAEEKSQRVMQFLTSLSNEESHATNIIVSGSTSTTPSSSDATHSVSALSTDVVEPATASLWRAVEAAFSGAVEEWLQGQTSGDATHRDDSAPRDSTNAVEDASLEGERSLARGVALSLSHVPLQAEHLPLLVEYVDAASSVPFAPNHRRGTDSNAGSVATTSPSPSLSRRRDHGQGGREAIPRALLVQGRIPIRSVDLTGLVSSASVSQRVFHHLLDLVQRVGTILVLHVSQDTCPLTPEQCAALSQALADNLAHCQRRARAERREQRKEAVRRAQHERDDMMNFFFWENAERCALMELEHRTRHDIRATMREAERTTVRKAQEAFTRSRLAAERMEFYRFASESLRDFYAQSLSALIRQQIKFLQQQESRSRSQVVGAMSSALDKLVMDRKAEVARLNERAKTATAARKDVILALLRQESASRAAVAGEYTALAVASLMYVWLRYRARPTIADTMRHLYLGPLLYHSRWSIQGNRTGDPRHDATDLEKEGSMSPSPLRACGADPRTSFRDLSLTRQSSSLHNLSDVANAALRSSKPVVSPAGGAMSSGSFRIGRAASPLAISAGATSPASSKASLARSNVPSGGSAPESPTVGASDPAAATFVGDPTTHDDDLPAPEE